MYKCCLIGLIVYKIHMVMVGYTLLTLLLVSALYVEYNHGYTVIVDLVLCILFVIIGSYR